MKSNELSGNYTRAFLNKDSSESKSLKSIELINKIELEENQAVFVFSLKENSLIFAKGFEQIFGWKDGEVNALMLDNFVVPEQLNFTNEMNDRILFFLHTSKNLENFSYNRIIKSINTDIPIMCNARVFETDNNNNMLSIIVSYKLDSSLKIADVMQYSCRGINDPKKEYELNNNLDFKLAICEQNIKLIELLEKGKSYDKVSKVLDLSIEKIEELIKNLLARFDLKNETELINFAKEQFLIPNQFARYN